MKKMAGIPAVITGVVTTIVGATSLFGFLDLGSVGSGIVIGVGLITAIAGITALVGLE